jgi:hypothetical protein
VIGTVLVAYIVKSSYKNQFWSITTVASVMLCNICSEMTQTPLDRSWEFPHHESYHDLKQSALNGCALCGLFRESILQEDSRKWGCTMQDADGRRLAADVNYLAEDLPYYHVDNERRIIHNADNPQSKHRPKVSVGITFRTNDEIDDDPNASWSYFSLCVSRGLSIRVNVYSRLQADKGQIVKNGLEAIALVHQFPQIPLSVLLGIGSLTVEITMTYAGSILTRIFPRGSLMFRRTRDGNMSEWCSQTKPWASI